MKIPPLKLEGLPPAVAAEIRGSGALVEVQHASANGLRSHNVRVVFGNLDLTGVLPGEIAKIAAANPAGVYWAGEDASDQIMPPDPDTMSRDKFDALSAVERMNWIRSGKRVVD